MDIYYILSYRVLLIHYTAKRDYSRFKSIMLAVEIPVIGSKISI